MNKIILFILGFALLATSAAASVLVLKDDICIEDVEILMNENWFITFSHEGRHYQIGANHIVEVAEAVPEGYPAITAAEFPDYISQKPTEAEVTEATEDAPAPETSGPDNWQQFSPTETASTPDSQPPIDPEDVFQIQDVSWVDDTDFLFNAMLNGYYTSSGTGQKINTNDWSKTDAEASQMEIDGEIAGRGYTLPAEWQFSIPVQFFADPHEIFLSHPPGSSIRSIVGTDGELYYYPHEMFLGLVTDYSGYFREAASNHRIQAAIRAGAGRLYRGRHAYQALQIIEDLRHDNKLLKPLAREDAQELSAIIAHARNKYLFDERAEILNAMEAIADFLLERGYIGDVRSVLIADDTYRNLSDIDRDFGFRGFIQYCRLYDDGSPQLPDDGLEEQSHLFGVGSDMAFPFSRTWQLNASIGLDARFNDSIKTENTEYYTYYDYYYYYYPYTYSLETCSETRARNILFEPHFDLEVQYLPTTRLLLSLSNQFLMTYGKFNTQEERWNYVSSYYYYYTYRKFLLDYDYIGMQWQNRTELSLAYQLSQRLALEIAVGLTYAYTSVKDVTGTSQDVEMGTLIEYSAPDTESFEYEVSFTLGVNYRFF